MHEPDFVDACYADKDLSLLKKLTLVIPTYNRNYYLSRCLWYHAHFPFGEIIVADSSPEEKKVVNRETVAKVREMFGANIRYLEYEPETEKYGGDIYRKWGDAVQHVDLEYSILTTDKQFVLPLALHKEIAYLDQNPDYVSAEGMRYWMEKDSKQQLAYLVGRDFQETPSITSANSIDRYKEALCNESDGLFMIYKSDIHKKIYYYLKSGKITDIRFAEVFIRSAGYLFGKSIFLPDTTTLCRDVIQMNRKGRMNLSESSSQRYPDMDDYHHLGVYEQFFNAYLTDLNRLIVEEFPDSTSNDIEKLINLIQLRMQDNTGDKIEKLSLYTVMKKHPIIKYLWRRTPMLVKQPIRIITGYDDSRRYIDNLPANLLLIGKIVDNTQILHRTDQSIFVM